MKRKYLFCGLGSIGKRHAHNLKNLEDCEILALRTRRESLGDWGREHGVRELDHWDEALREKPRAVFVTNPTRFHLETARKAAEAGCPLFIEKPLSDSLDGVDAFIELCRKRRLTVLLGYKLRFHPAVKLMKSLVAEGKLGRIVSATARYGGYLPDWHPYEDYRRMYSARRELGGGIVLDAIHEIDALYWIMGDFKEVGGACGKYSDLEIDTEDTADMLVEFPQGGIGHIHMDYIQRPEGRFYRIVGTEGTLIWDSSQPYVSFYNAKTRATQRIPEPHGFEASAVFVDEMKHFLGCLDGTQKPIHSLEDARRVLEIACWLKSRQVLTQTCEETIG